MTGGPVPSSDSLARRAGDWPESWRSRPPTARASPALGELGALLSGFERLLSAEDTDTAVRRAIEVARSHVGLDRVGIFLVDERHEHMLGTWGTDLDGQVVDEHQLAFQLNAGVVDVFRGAESESRPFTVLDGCPIVVQRSEELVVVGQGWLVCTPIRSARARIGIMYNDAGLSSAPVDESKQARAAILCAVLAGVLETAQGLPPSVRSSDPPPVKHPAVRTAVQRLARDPTLASRELAASAGIGQGRLGRLFKSELGVSLVGYRNRVRVERLLTLFAAGQRNLSELARAAGFGSYAQFHRVFRAAYGVTPRDYVRAAERG